MDFTYTLTGSILEIKASGPYTIEDIRSQFGHILATIAPMGQLSLLVDARESEHSPSAQDLDGVAEFASSLLGKVNERIALLVSNDMRFGLGRMLEVFGESHGVSFKVFRDRLKAVEWLTTS